MSQRAAWQLERLGFAQVHDFVAGKAHWLASGRPTVRSSVIARVGSHITPAVTALADETVASARQAISGSSTDVVVVNALGIVLGRLRKSDLDAADGSDLLADVMRLGPTTVRPDEPLDAVTTRMVDRGVKSLLVTRPTGELIGWFIPREETGG